MKVPNLNAGMHAGAKSEIFRFAEELRKKMTMPEKILWNYLKQKPLGFKFRRQHPFYRYILDFYCHKAKLSIEIDGAYHLSKEQKKLDNLRTKTITSIGLKELRFSNEEVMKDTEDVIDKIETLLKDSK